MFTGKHKQFQNQFAKHISELYRMLAGKKILLGVTGSIAAYKAAYLVRLLIQTGAEVRVMMTPGAIEFVSPLTFATLSGNPVVSDFTENKNTGEWTRHVEMAQWADLIVIAPLTANTIAKMVMGQSDNFLLATYMSAECKVMIAPAMDREMYAHPGTSENLKKLKEFGHIIVEPTHGSLASGLMGKGRMEEPEEILDEVIRFFHPALPLEGKHFIVTAGPTYEKIDPVRFIGNYSSGKMGFAIALALASKGARVQLICGPVNSSIQHPLVVRTDVESAEQMHKAATELWAKMDGAILAAAVADFKPSTNSDKKIKKENAELLIKLEKTPDIAASLGKSKKDDQILVGFALETDNELENAKSKLDRKNLDMIVLNSLNDKGAGFASETNKITLIWPGNKSHVFGLKSKSQVAVDIVDELIKLVKK